MIVIYDFYAKYTFIERNYFLLNRIFRGFESFSQFVYEFFFTVPLLLPTCLYCPSVVTVFLFILVLPILLFLSALVLKHVIILLCPDKLLLISFYVCDFHYWDFTSYFYVHIFEIYKYF